MCSSSLHVKFQQQCLPLHNTWKVRCAQISRIWHCQICIRPPLLMPHLNLLIFATSLSYRVLSLLFGAPNSALCQCSCDGVACGLCCVWYSSCFSGPEEARMRRLVQQKADLVIKAYFTQHGQCTSMADLESLQCVLQGHDYGQWPRSFLLYSSVTVHVRCALISLQFWFYSSYFEVILNCERTILLIKWMKWQAI